MVVIVDYGCGNIGSIANMLKHIGVTDVAVSSSPDAALRADRLILPGVGREPLFYRALVQSMKQRRDYQVHRAQLGDTTIAALLVLRYRNSMEHLCLYWTSIITRSSH